MRAETRSGEVIRHQESKGGREADRVKTQEWSLLEPGHENKWYARGIGCVKAVATDGTPEVLISVTKP